jgi:hypothetical protein
LAHTKKKRNGEFAKKNLMSQKMRRIFQNDVFSSSSSSMCQKIYGFLFFGASLTTFDEVPTVFARQ